MEYGGVCAEVWDVSTSVVGLNYKRQHPISSIEKGPGDESAEQLEDSELRYTHFK